MNIQEVGHAGGEPLRRGALGGPVRRRPFRRRAYSGGGPFRTAGHSGMGHSGRGGSQVRRPFRRECHSGGQGIQQGVSLRKGGHSERGGRSGGGGSLARGAIHPRSAMDQVRTCAKTQQTYACMARLLTTDLSVLYPKAVGPHCC